jgi:hypothetical protein
MERLPKTVVAAPRGRRHQEDRVYLGGSAMPSCEKSLPGWKRDEGLAGFSFISYNMGRNEKLAEAA